MLTSLLNSPPVKTSLYTHIKNTEPLTTESIQAFAKELNQLKAEVSAKIGEEDVIYVESVQK